MPDKTRTEHPDPPVCPFLRWPSHQLRFCVEERCALYTERNNHVGCALQILTCIAIDQEEEKR